MVDTNRNIPFKIICKSSAITSNVLKLDRSSGMTCFFTHVPHANWKKSLQGSALRSIADNRDDAVFTHSIVVHGWRFAVSNNEIRNFVSKWIFVLYTNLNDFTQQYLHRSVPEYRCRPTWRQSLQPIRRGENVPIGFD